MKVRKLMQLLHTMDPNNEIVVQEVNNEGRMLVETTYAIVEVQPILHWTYINIAREHAEAR